MSSIQKSYLDPNKMFPDPLLFMEEQTCGFLQALFGQFTPKSGCYHFSTDDADSTEILIEGRSTDNLQNVDTRPKIVVGRGPSVWENRGINNLVGSKNLSFDRQRFSDIIEGTVGISCFARELRESSAIANICFGAFKKFQTVLRQQGYLLIKSTQVGQTAKIKSDVRPELFVTPVMVRIQLTQNWTVTKAAPVKLQKFETEVIPDPPGDG